MLSRLMTHLSFFRFNVELHYWDSREKLQRMCIVVCLVQYYGCSLMSKQMTTGRYLSSSSPTFSLCFVAFLKSFIIRMTTCRHTTLHYSIAIDATIKWDAINVNHRSPVEREIAFTRGKRVKERRSSCSLCKTRRSN